MYANCRGLDHIVRSPHIPNQYRPIFGVRGLQWRHRLPSSPGGCSDNVECRRCQFWDRVILFGRSMGPAVFIAIAQVMSTNQLSSSLADVVPGLTPTYIEEHGLGDIKNGVLIQRWGEVLGVVLACLLVEWRSVKQKQS
ncbi:Major facilitator superfamily domain general substrate transporter [Penicillium concentricum]|uniref:Major facilitator superfamily domain general substrate transporter n=1 Tax=Penicillium concentricum TaxID=293559 RepID=A0A9W9VBU6_9EURO|nr:Major facilitator superfamily domain general substrate transporter [Penicillium concentricum]KAJ5374949.1 Major facilitator superfamily domain general substrate transporter [Penicillium concentricum]